MSEYLYNQDIRPWVNSNLELVAMSLTALYCGCGQCKLLIIHYRTVIVSFFVSAGSCEGLFPGLFPHNSRHRWKTKSWHLAGHLAL